MRSSKKRHAGGSYRLYETMMVMHCKPGKDRTKAKKHNKHKEKRRG